MNTIWTKGIPQTNLIFGLLSLLLVFGVDLYAVISNPDLSFFWFIMLIIFGVFAIFFYLENVVFCKKFANSTSKLDIWISLVIVIRNVLFLLNFIPIIQLFGLIGIVSVGWVIGLVYLFLIIARLNS